MPDPTKKPRQIALRQRKMRRRSLVTFAACYWFVPPAMAPQILPNYGPFDLKSAVVLITGGSSGIGEGLAEEFLKAGSTVIVTGRRESALKQTQAKHPDLHIYVNDASKAEEREALSQWVIKEFPKVNVLVNNAGIMRSGPLSKETDWSARQSEIAINIEAPVHLMQLLTPHFLKQKEAAFINLSSGLGYVPCGTAPVYGGTKAFVHHFTMGSRFHYANSKIRVVEISPPSVKSNLGGGHDTGEETDVFCDHVFKHFAASEAEIGFNFSEKARLAPRADNEKTSVGMWEKMAKGMPVFESEA